MSSKEIDPEVLADLQLRARTERDPTRSRQMPTFEQAAVIGQVPCRNRCGALVDWTDVAEDRFVTFNRQLEARNEPPMDKTRIVFCNACRAYGRELGAQSNRNQVEALREVIQKLKASANPERERELLDKLRKYNHPDIDGLLEALRQKREQKPAGRRAKTTEVMG